MSLLLERLGRPAGEPIQQKTIFGRRQAEAKEDNYQELKLAIHRRIVDEMSDQEQQFLASNNHTRAEVEELISSYCQRVLDDSPMSVPRGERARIVADICDEILGLGPIEPLLKDESITEVMINGPKKIFVERKGKLQLTNVQFHDDAHLMNIIERIVSPLGRRIDEASPLVDARLADGSRVNAIVPPLSLIGPCVTIRKFTKNPLSIDNLVGFGTLSEEMAEFLEACVKARLNIMVSGGTGSGKTTTLNVLSSFIPDRERIVTIEDAAELRLQQQHVVTLESRPANLEGRGAITIRDLVRNALRMRPDRIIVGEVRSGEALDMLQAMNTGHDGSLTTGHAGEALDMLQAMNTGHDGSLTTGHANSPRDILSRLETMVMMAGMDLPVRAIREQIASALDLIIQQSRIQDGSRKITYITEVQKMEGDTIVLQDLFTYVQTGINESGKSVGYYEASGLQPMFLQKFKMNGVELPKSFMKQLRGE